MTLRKLVCGVVAAGLSSGGVARAGEADRARIVPMKVAGLAAGVVAHDLEPRIGRMPITLRQQETFLNGHLLPAMSQQFETMAPAMDAAGALPLDSVSREGWIDAARHGAEKGAREALGSYLLEFTFFGRGVRSIQSRGERFREPVAAAPGQAMRFGLGVSHGIPKVKMRCRRGAARLEVGLGIDRSLGIELNHSRATETRLKADYNPGDRRYGLSCLFSF